MEPILTAAVASSTKLHPWDSLVSAKRTCTARMKLIERGTYARTLESTQAHAGLRHFPSYPARSAEVPQDSPPPLLGKEGPPKLPPNLPHGRRRANGCITSNVLCHIVPVFPVFHRGNHQSLGVGANSWIRSVHLNPHPPATARVWFQGMNPSRELPGGPQGQKNFKPQLANLANAQMGS